MKPPPRLRVLINRYDVGRPERREPERRERERERKQPERRGRRQNVCNWLLVEQRRLLKSLERLTRSSRRRRVRAEAPLDYEAVQRRVPKRTVEEVRTVVRSLQARAVSRAAGQLLWQRRKEAELRDGEEEEEEEEPLRRWRETARFVAGDLEEVIATAFSQMLVVSSTEPQTLSHSTVSPPRPGSAHPTTTGPAHLTTTGPAHPTTTGPAHPTTTSPAHLTTTGPAHPTTTGPAHPTTTGPAHLTTTGPAHLTTTGPAHLTTTGPAHPTMTGPAHPTTTGPAHPTTTGPAHPTTPGPAHPTPTGRGASLLPRCDKSNPDSESPGTPGPLPPGGPSPGGPPPVLQTPARGPPEGPEGPPEGPPVGTPVPPSTPEQGPSATPSLALPGAGCQATASPPATDEPSSREEPAEGSGDAGLGEQFSVDFQKIYLHLSHACRPGEHGPLSPMECAVVLDLLMALSEELPLLDGDALRQHMTETYASLSAPVPPPAAPRAERGEDPTPPAAAPGPARDAVNSRAAGEHSGSDDHGERVVPPPAPPPCPPLNPFTVPLKLLAKRS